MLNAAQIAFVMKLIFDLAVALQCDGSGSEKASSAVERLCTFCSDIPLTGEAPSGFFPDEDGDVMPILDDALQVIHDDR